MANFPKTTGEFRKVCIAAMKELTKGLGPEALNNFIVVHAIEGCFIFSEQIGRLIYETEENDG